MCRGCSSTPKAILDAKVGVQSHSYLRPGCFSISKGRHAQATRSMQSSFTLLYFTLNKWKKRANLLQCMKVTSESEVAQSCLTLGDLMDCSLPGSSVQRSLGMPNKSGFIMMKSLLISHSIKWADNIIPKRLKSETMPL